jgi:uncharacterized repeat protein (TIGR01451 family)
MGMRNFAWGKLLVSALIWLVTAIAAPAWAQSACTALWGSVDDGAGVKTLRYYNTTTNNWVAVAPLAGNANALAGDAATGLLYYVDRATNILHSFNLNTLVDTSIGVVPTPAPANPANLLGGTFSADGRLFMSSTTGTQVAIAEVDKTSGAILTTWRTINTNTTTIAVAAGSGDISTDASGTTYLYSNTNPPTRWPLTLPATGSAGTFLLTAGSQVITNIAANNIAAAAVNPLDQLIYIADSLAANTTTYRLSGLAATAVQGVVATQLVSDMGNCFAPPAKPSVTKTMGPAYSAASPGTTTVVITLSNTNSVPVYLFAPFIDELPAGMVVANPLVLSSTCSSALGTPTTSVGATSVTFATGRIPASPGCSISFNVSATASVSAYTNTIPAGSLTTSAGTNTAAVTATYKVGTDFSAAKSQCSGICGTPVTTPVSLASGQTMQYVLTIANSSVGGTGSATFTDTLPAALTPVLSITAGAIGGGTCTTATAVVGGATQISGTFANAPAGAQCLVTVTALVSAQASANTVTNTLTIATTAGTSDTNPANNTAAVLSNLGPATLLTITKTNNTSTVAAGSTTSYTITIANFGPANAPNSIIKDPAAAGLNCTAATCAVTSGTAACPAGTPAALMTALQSAGGASIPTFNSGSTLSFVVTCGVTATGQ